MPGTMNIMVHWEWLPLKKIGGNPYMVNMILSLRKLRLTQLLTNLYEKIVVRPTSGSGGTRMKMMVARRTNSI